jgi:hypothetical protein
VGVQVPPSAPLDDKSVKSPGQRGFFRFQQLKAAFLFKLIPVVLLYFFVASSKAPTLSWDQTLENFIYEFLEQWL